jgi:hypothetical protein
VEWIMRWYTSGGNNRYWRTDTDFPILTRVI